MSESCPFCRIIRRHLPAFVLTEDDHVIVFLSKENHPLIVSKQHIPNIYALDDTTGAHLMRAAIQIARAVKAGLQCEIWYCFVKGQCVVCSVRGVIRLQRVARHCPHTLACDLSWTGTSLEATQWATSMVARDLTRSLIPV